MERLSGLDGHFLAFESPTERMHHLTLFVLAPERGGEPITYEAVRAHVAARLPLLPVFRRRIVEVPYGAGHPVWLDGVPVDLDQHVLRHEVPPGAGPSDLDRAMVEVGDALMSRDRPLWELYVLEGLAGGRTGVIMKLHHAVCDGTGILNIYRALWSALDELDPSTVGAGAEPPVPDPLPDRKVLLRAAGRNDIGLLRRAPGVVRSAVRNGHAKKAYAATALAPCPRPPDVPRTVFNRAVSSTLVYASVTVPLADLQDVKRALGDVTFNDVVLAMGSGALRRWLERTGELPDASMVASVPVGTDRDTSPWQSGNRVSYFNTTLATDEPDPLRRMALIHQGTTFGKRALELQGTTAVQEWADYALPALVGAFRWASGRFDLLEKAAPTNHLTLSNLAGPRALFRPGPFVVENTTVVGPPFNGAVLNITALTYGPHVNFAVQADAGALPDAEAFAAELPRALEELRVAATGAARTPDSLAG